MKYEGELYTIYTKYLLPENIDGEEANFRKHFEENHKQDALDCFKKECAICHGKFKNWKHIKGINHAEWHNGKFYYILELRNLPLYSL